MNDLVSGHHPNKLVLKTFITVERLFISFKLNSLQWLQTDYNGKFGNVSTPARRGSMVLGRTACSRTSDTSKTQKELTLSIYYPIYNVCHLDRIFLCWGDSTGTIIVIIYLRLNIYSYSHLTWYRCRWKFSIVGNFGRVHWDLSWRRL